MINSNRCRSQAEEKRASSVGAKGHSASDGNQRTSPRSCMDYVSSTRASAEKTMKKRSAFTFVNVSSPL
eukprot:6213471-Pleurochrysis_carterae.AAC.4